MNKKENEGTNENGNEEERKDEERMGVLLTSYQYDLFGRNIIYDSTCPND